MRGAARVVVRNVQSAPSRSAATAAGAKNSFLAPEHTRLSGLSTVHDPWTNKGTGFPMPERDRLRIRGLVPPRTLTLETQALKVKDVLDRKVDDLEKHSFLADLQVRNETLYFRLLLVRRGWGSCDGWQTLSTRSRSTRATARAAQPLTQHCTLCRAPLRRTTSRSSRRSSTRRPLAARV